MADGSLASIAAIVLAAGASTRLGQPKQLVALGGEPLVRRAARLALEAGCAPVMVVLGACGAPCRAALEGLDVTSIENPDWREGMGSTLRCGMIALAASGIAPDSVLVMVSDQVGLTAESLSSLLTAHEHHARPAATTAATPATAARYAGRLGVPAVFRRELFPALLALTGNQGARTLLAQLGPAVAPVELPEAAAELDTPEDLAKVR